MFLEIRLASELAPIVGVEPPAAREKEGLQLCKPFVLIGGPGRVRTDDLFHAMEARSQLRHRPT
jgi:hypothetical protein